jgi:hypothetical protein
MQIKFQVVPTNYDTVYGIKIIIKVFDELTSKINLINHF